MKFIYSLSILLSGLSIYYFSDGFSGQNPLIGFFFVCGVYFLFSDTLNG